MAYKDLNAMYNDWVNACKDAVTQVVPEVMKEKMSEAVEFEVYGKYSPSLYARRGSGGGMADKGNYEVDIDVNSRKITISLVNRTPPSEENRIVYLDRIVVTGKGYNWRNSRIYQNPIARDFYAKTEELLNDGELRSKLISALRSKGIQVK